MCTHNADKTSFKSSPSVGRCGGGSHPGSKYIRRGWEERPKISHFQSIISTCAIDIGKIG